MRSGCAAVFLFGETCQRIPPPAEGRPDSAFIIPHSAFILPSMADWRLGTMGFGYDDWSGPFYPRGLGRGEWLSFYGKHFNAVELDTTFHGAPDVTRVRRWAASVPDDFRFCAK